MSYEDYCKRAVELGHGIISSVEHGWQGRYIECYELAHKYNLKFLFGTEAYWVKDRLSENEKGSKDGTNCHICILAMNENGRRAINDILSEAAISGYYRQSRIDLGLILSLPKDDVIITSACVAFWKYDDIDDIVLQLHEHFGKNFYLEVQYHNTDTQAKINSHILELKRRYGIQLIMGCDSHYIYETGAADRDEYIRSKGMIYDDEDGWYMDYPDGETAYKRFAEQCVLSHEDIIEAMENTNVFLNVEEYDCPIFNHDVKMPSLYPDKTQTEKDKMYEDLIWSKWDEYKKEVSQEEWTHYEKEIAYEIDIVKQTFHSDYFLLDYAIAEEGKRRGGRLTLTGRGSAVSFITNKLLGFTDVDRIAAKVKMYPERFMSPTRILETHSLADIDMNVAEQEPFWEAQESILGYNHSKQMIAYQQMKPPAAWKMYAKAQNIDFETANQVSDQIKKWQKDVAHADEDSKDDIDIYEYIAPEFHEIYKKSEEYQGVVTSVSPHPCFTENELVYTDKGYKFIKDIEIGDNVLDMDGEYSSVIAKSINLSKDVYHYYFEDLGKIEATSNHPFYVSESYKKNNKRYLKEPRWKQASELVKGDYVAIPLEKCKNIIPHFEDIPTEKESFWWIVGRYLGDEWLKKIYNNRPGEYVITVCCNKNDYEIDEILEKYKELNFYNFWVEEASTVFKIHISNKSLYYFLSQFKQGASEKELNNSIFDLPHNLLKSFLNGYISADGHIDKNGRAIYFSSISKKLAFGIAKCVNLIYQVPCSIYEQIPAPSVMECGRKIIAKHIRYKGTFIPFRPKKKMYYYDDKYIWIPFVKAEKYIGIHDVYNLEVEKSHTYTINNVVVHNCASLVFDGDIRTEIGYIYVKPKGDDGRICCCMDGKWAEKYGFLKNDWLKVNVVKAIFDVFDRAGVKPISVNQLLKECTPDSDAWKMYKSQCTFGLNQVEQPGSATRVKTYAPTNISELAAFVAAIRPGFKSMYKVFESRKHFDYGIPAFDNLIQTEEMPNTFVLYQEQAMATLNYAGVPMSECYAVIKSIAKKRAEEVYKYKEVFIPGFTARIMEDDHVHPDRAEEIAHQVWQIIEDSSAYSFNASHAYCVALDSLYGAWLKSKYPLAFYEVYLRILNDKGDKDRLNKFKEEAEKYFKIVFPPYKFGQDNRSITIDVEHNSINNALSSIKGYSDSISEEFYNASKETSDFISVLKYLDDKSIKSAKIIPLIKIGYFSDFGNTNELLSFIEVFDLLKQGSAKQISKEKIQELQNGIVALKDIDISQFVTDKNKNGSEAKNWKINDMDGLLTYLFEFIKSKNLPDASYGEKMKYQLEILGYIDLTTGRKEDTKRVMITDAVKPLVGQYSPDPWAYRVETKSIGTGRTATLNIKADVYEDYGPLKKFDVILVGEIKRNKKGYWYIYDYEKEG